MAKQGARSGGWGVWAAAVVLLGVVGTVAAFAWRRMHPQTPLGRAMAYMPRDVALVGAVDTTVLREHPALRARLQQGLADPDVQRARAEATAGCGFDPYESVESFAAGLLPRAPGVREQGVVVVGVRASATAIERCMRWVDTRYGGGRALVSVAPVEGRHAFAPSIADAMARMGSTAPSPALPPAPPGPAAPTTPSDGVIVVVDEAIVMGTRALVQRALSSSGRRGGPDRLTALERLAEANSPDTVIFAAADLAALRGADPTTFAVSTGLAGVAVPWLAYVNTAQAVAYTASQNARGVHARAVATLPTPVEAQAAAASFTSWWGSARSLVILGLGLVGGQLNTASATAVASNPALGAEVPKAQAALQLALSVVNRINPQAVDTQVRFDLDLSVPELQTFSEGANAGVRLMNSGVNLSPSGMPGIGAGGGGPNLVF